MSKKLSHVLADLTHSKESFRMTVRKNFREKVWFSVFGLIGLLAVVVVVFLLFVIFNRGISTLSWEFLTSPPLQQMTSGGIFPAILGTFYLSLLTLLFSLPIGVSAAIYLHEWAGKGWFVRLIRLSIRNLAGVPSIVYGLFGLALFSSGLGLGNSLLSASLTLSLMTLPIVITSSEESLKAVPNGFREAALSLGATKWETIKLQVLPYAIPGMATGSILGLARAAGETAPIILTGAAYYLPYLPQSVFDRFMALPYHLYILATQHSDIGTVRPIAFATALVLILIVLFVNSIAILARAKIRKRKLW